LSKATLFWPTLIFVYVADFITKHLVVTHLSPAYVPHKIIGDYVRFTLAYNRDAAMGLSLGDYSRAGFTITAAAVLVVLFALYRRTPATNLSSVVALAMIAGGALGNLTDRIRSSLGVVDYIDVGIGNTRFWTFNVADAAVTCGAILLAVVSMRRDKTEQEIVP
jgi:signal peptidase II